MAVGAALLCSAGVVRPVSAVLGMETAIKCVREGVGWLLIARSIAVRC